MWKQNLGSVNFDSTTSRPILIPNLMVETVVAAIPRSRNAVVLLALTSCMIPITG